VRKRREEDERPHSHHGDEEASEVLWLDGVSCKRRDTQIFAEVSV
jgi:hypothetical protein